MKAKKYLLGGGITVLILTLALIFNIFMFPELLTTVNNSSNTPDGEIEPISYASIVDVTHEEATPSINEKTEPEALEIAKEALQEYIENDLKIIEEGYEVVGITDFNAAISNYETEYIAGTPPLDISIWSVHFKETKPDGIHYTTIIVDAVTGEVRKRQIRGRIAIALCVV